MQLQMASALLVCAIKSCRKELLPLAHAAILMDSFTLPQWYVSAFADVVLLRSACRAHCCYNADVSILVYTLLLVADISHDTLELCGSCKWCYQ
jgi:hypothetical protein